MRPAKQFDDIIDDIRALAVTWGVPSRAKTEQEEIESRMSDNLKSSEIAQHFGQPGYGELVISQQMEQRRIKAQIEEERQNEQTRISNIWGGRRVHLIGRRRK